MRQIIQSFKTGETILETVPAPQAGYGQVLIRTRISLVSLGTERMLVEFGKGSLLAKARAQPDKVKMVLDKIRAEGLLPTLEAVFSKLEQPIPLGYCNVGEVIAVGAGVPGLAVGDRVASNGPHAEYVAVPHRLCARIPDSVTDEQAAFTVIASIGLQGIRLLNPTLGETVTVSGLGLIGLLAAQLLKASGCRVLGFDFDAKKVELARSFGIEAVDLSGGQDPVAYALAATNGVGVDGVLVTASAKGDELMSQAARQCRKRGRIVLVGVTGLGLSRAEFYEKELSFQVSCSYGPGRYDEDYEQKGQDYPIGFVRWTEQRNFEAILHAIEAGTVQVDPLITERVPLDRYQDIYGQIGQSRAIASLLVYPNENSDRPATSIVATERSFSPGEPVAGIIGAGNFTKATMLPAMKGANAQVKYIASAGGLSGTLLAKKAGIARSTTRYQDMLEDPEVRLVMITTRHNAHARQVVESLQAGKHVFVEKPLALTSEQLESVRTAAEAHPELTVTVGFNRRFSPHVQKMHKLLGKTPGPLNMVFTMNAGFIPANHWVHDPAVGGGRLVGEACHFIDLAAYLAQSPVTAVCANALGPNVDERADNAMILLRFASGAQAVVNYLSNGSKAYSKERAEVYHQGRTLVLDNFRTLKGYGYSGADMKTSLDKGHREQFRLLFERLRTGGPALIPFESLYNTAKASLAILESLKTGGWIEV